MKPTLALTQASAERPVLAAGEIDLWWIEPKTCAGAAASAWSAVSPVERARALRIRNVIVREHFLMQHQALREILGSYAGLPPDSLAFEISPFGKPVLAAQHGGTGLHFNLSRSGGAAVLAVTWTGRLGVDLERLRPVPEIDTIARRMFSPAEAQALAATPADERSDRFLRLWTCKEAVVKALGGGLSIALDAFDIEHPADSPPTISRWQLDAQQLGGLRLIAVPKIAGHALALAADAPGYVCRLLRWHDDPGTPENPPS